MRHTNERTRNSTYPVDLVAPQMQTTAVPSLIAFELHSKHTFSLLEGATTVEVGGGGVRDASVSAKAQTHLAGAKCAQEQYVLKLVRAAAACPHVTRAEPTRVTKRVAEDLVRSFWLLPRRAHLAHRNLRFSMQSEEYEG